jgi:large subunit ribosomal protein L35
MRCRRSLITINNKKMPKLKTNAGAKKRFRFTGSGKVKRHHAYHSHILTKKTKKQKRNLAHSAIVDQSNMKQVRDLLCLR